MSSSMVGTVYSRVIEEVCSDCRTTFEEEGVDKKLLDEVKVIWQKKISERQVALMPWDPAPPAAAPPGAPVASTPANRPPQPVPSSAPAPGQGPSPMQRVPSQNAQNGSNGVQIKSEPNPQYDLKNLPNNATERAQQNVKDYMATMTQLPQAHQTQGQGQAQGQGQGQPRNPAQQMSPEELRRRVQQNQQRMQGQMTQAQSQPLGNAQTDGAGDGSSDWASFVAARRAAVVESAGEADVLFKERIESMARDMEGGGLMAPLSEVQRRNKGKTRATGTSKAHGSGMGQVDGGDESDDEKLDIKEHDEDAINSDLDDSDDDEIEEADDENDREMMLCTYDKVQRVKNKWKCTLKDGVLSTGGKEYVFHKAQGEFEW